MATVAAFHTQGSNLIKVDLYSDTELDTTVSLINNNVVQSSIIVPSDLYNDGKAFVVFNFLLFPAETNSIEAEENNIVSKCEVQIIESEGSTNNLIEDNLTDKTKANTTEIDADMNTEDMPEEEVLNIDFTSPELNKIGSNAVLYSGGGNRYLNNTEGLLIKQKNPCTNIDDKYSPLQLNSIFKCEDYSTNYFTSWSYTENLIEGTELVQGSITANGYKNRGGFNNNKIELYCEATVEISEINPNICFSSLLRSNTTCMVNLEIYNDAVLLGSKKYELNNEYQMCNVAIKVESTIKLKFVATVISNSRVCLYTLLPQIENYFCPTSRIITGSRNKDEILIESSSISNVICTGESCSPIGGSIEVSFVSSRNTQDNNCIIDWRNEDLDGLLIYQDEDGSFVASFGDSFISRSKPQVMEEGSTYDICVSWTDYAISIKVNDDDAVYVEFGSIPLPSIENPPEYIRVGNNKDLNSMCGDIYTVKVKK